MAQFTEADLDKLSGPHVARLWFAELDLPSGLARLHNGVGRITVGGYEWRGVTDPIVGQLVSIDAVEDPRFGQAASVQIVLSGVNVEFYRSVKADARALEGRRADLYWAAFDPETGEIVIGLKKLFPGKMSAPSLHRQGIGTRTVGLTIESMWQSQNYPFSAFKWSAAGQQARFPGDKGGEFIGVRVSETFK